MEIEITVREYLEKYLDLYKEAKYYSDNYRQIFVEKEKNRCSDKNLLVHGLFKSRPMSDDEIYQQYVNNERVFGDSEMGFNVHLMFVRDFLSTYRKVLNFCSASINDDKVVIDEKNKIHADKKIHINSNDLKHVSKAHSFKKSYFN